MRKLWKFDWGFDCAYISGLFVATDEEVNNLIGKELYLGDVAGKGSDVFGTVGIEDISLVSDNPIVVNAVGNFGINPLEYV